MLEKEKKKRTMRERCDICMRKTDDVIDGPVLTGLLYDDVVGNSSSVFVPRCALVHKLVMLGLRSADVHHQGPGVGLHGHVGVFIDVKVGPISGPGET